MSVCQLYSTNAGSPHLTGLTANCSSLRGRLLQLPVLQLQEPPASPMYRQCFCCRSLHACPYPLTHSPSVGQLTPV